MRKHQRQIILQVINKGAIAIPMVAVTLLLVLLRIWMSPVIPGAGAGYDYVSLGYKEGAHVIYSEVSSTAVNRLQALLPAGFQIAFAVPGELSLGQPFSEKKGKISVEYIIGNYFHTLHIRPVAGRLLTESDNRAGARVVDLNLSIASKLFGNAQDAIGGQLVDSFRTRLRVVGVLPNNFQGSISAAGRPGVPSPVAWIPSTLLGLTSSGSWGTKNGSAPPGNLVDLMPISGPAAILSFPSSANEAQVRGVLDRLYHDSRSFLPKEVRGFAISRPYSIFPTYHYLIAQRIKMFLFLALVMLAMASANTLMSGWFRFLRERGSLRLERILGAQRRHFITRFILRMLVDLFIIFAICSLLTASTFPLHARLPDALGAVFTPRVVAGAAIWVLPVVLLVVACVEFIPLLALLLTSHLGPERVAGETQGDRNFGVLLTATEVSLGLVVSVLAIWAVTFAWRQTHQDIGYLTRRATLIQLNPLEGSRSVDRAKGSDGRIMLSKLLQVIHYTVPNADVGAGPVVERSIGFDFPESVSVGGNSANACVIHATPGWIDDVGMHIVTGRGFSSRAMSGSLNNVVLLDSRLALHLYGSSSKAIGRTVVLAGHPDALRVIGVLSPVYIHGIRTNTCPILVKEMKSLPEQGGTSLILNKELGAPLMSLLQERIMSLLANEHMNLSIENVRNTDQTRDWLAAQQITQSRLFVAIALVAWAIALSGIVALLRLYLAQRRRLLAIESALGATPSRTYRSVVLGTLAVACIGAMVALLLLPWLARQYALLSGAQVVPYGAATWLALGVLLLAVFLVAHFPARRAARAEPATSLHEL